MRQIARGLKELGAQPDLILTSPYARAADTARILQKELDLGKKHLVETDGLKPGADAAALMREINDKYGTLNEIAVVGHEPGLSRLISVLISGDPTIPIVLKKGGVCRLSAEKFEYGRCATLEWLLAPAQLTEIAS